MNSLREHLYSLDFPTHPGYGREQIQQVQDVVLDELNEDAGTLKLGRSLLFRRFFDRSDLRCVRELLWLHTVLLRKSKFQLPTYGHTQEILGHQMSTSILCTGVIIYYLCNMVGGVAGRNLSSTYTPQSATAQQLLRIKTGNFFATHYESLGEEKTATWLQIWSDGTRRKLQTTTAEV